MNLQEMLTTENPDSITDEQLKKVSYGLVHGEFDLELQPRQLMLKTRLLEIEAAEKAALRARVQLPDAGYAYYDDSDDDEYEWS